MCAPCTLECLSVKLEIRVYQVIKHMCISSHLLYWLNLRTHEGTRCSKPLPATSVDSTLAYTLCIRTYKNIRIIICISMLQSYST